MSPLRGYLTPQSINNLCLGGVTSQSLSTMKTSLKKLATAAVVITLPVLLTSCGKGFFAMVFSRAMMRNREVRNFIYEFYPSLILLLLFWIVSVVMLYMNEQEHDDALYGKQVSWATGFLLICEIIAYFASEEIGITIFFAELAFLWIVPYFVYKFSPGKSLAFFVTVLLSSVAVVAITGPILDSPPPEAPPRGYQREVIIRH